VAEQETALTDEDIRRIEHPDEFAGESHPADRVDEKPTGKTTGGKTSADEQPAD